MKCNFQAIFYLLISLLLRITIIFSISFNLCKSLLYIIQNLLGLLCVPAGVFQKKSKFCLLSAKKIILCLEDFKPIFIDFDNGELC